MLPPEIPTLRGSEQVPGSHALPPAKSATLAVLIDVMGITRGIQPDLVRVRTATARARERQPLNAAAERPVVLLGCTEVSGGIAFHAVKPLERGVLGHREGAVGTDARLADKPEPAARHHHPEQPPPPADGAPYIGLPPVVEEAPGEAVRDGLMDECRGQFPLEPEPPALQPLGDRRLGEPQARGGLRVRRLSDVPLHEHVAAFRRQHRHRAVQQVHELAPVQLDVQVVIVFRIGDIPVPARRGPR